MAMQTCFTWVTLSWHVCLLGGESRHSADKSMLSHQRVQDPINRIPTGDSAFGKCHACGGDVTLVDATINRSEFQKAYSCSQSTLEGSNARAAAGMVADTGCAKRPLQQGNVALGKTCRRLFF